MPRVVAVGRFDGVHLGHRHLLSHGRDLARARGWSLLAYTFPPEFPALLPLPAKIRILQELADEVEVVDWKRVRELSPEDFLREEIVGRLGGRALVMGENHRFGRGAAGTPELARKLGESLGLEVHVVPPFLLGGEMVSAQRIRELVQSGEVERAAELLGRPPILVGNVVRGAGLARKLGFPTLNLEIDPVLIRPRDGVYVAWAFWPKGGGPALFYHGKRPSFPDLPPSAELHLLSAPPKSPPTHVEVHLLRFLRADTSFPSPAALAKQIKKDVEQAQGILLSLSPPKPILTGL